MSLKTLGFFEILLIGGGVAALGYFADRKVWDYLIFVNVQEETASSQPTALSNLEDSRFRVYETFIQIQIKWFFIGRQETLKRP